MTNEEIEQLAKEYVKSLSIKINKTEFTEYAILDFSNGYTQCQQDMADKIKESYEQGLKDGYACMPSINSLNKKD